MAPKALKTVSTGYKLKLKLLVDRQSRRVIFAEAGKEAVDFLLGLLSLPLASITRLLSPDGMVGSLGKLYASVQSLDDAFFIDPSRDRNALLNPKLAVPQPTTTLLLQNVPAPMTKKYYRCSAALPPDRGVGYCGGHSLGCSGDYRHVTNVYGTACPSCKRQMNVEMTFVDGAAEPVAEKARADAGGGYVRSVVTYMVMDDLVVRPMSTISAITLLHEFSVTDVSSLYEWTVELGMEEGLELLKASLQSQTVLTDVFGKKSKMAGHPPPAVKRKRGGK